MKLKQKIKLFVWNNFIEKYYKSWLDEYAEEYNEEVSSPEPNWAGLYSSDLD